MKGIMYWQLGVLDAWHGLCISYAWKWLLLLPWIAQHQAFRVITSTIWRVCNNYYGAACVRVMSISSQLQDLLCLRNSRLSFSIVMLEFWHLVLDLRRLLHSGFLPDFCCLLRCRWQILAIPFLSSKAVKACAQPFVRCFSISINQLPIL